MGFLRSGGKFLGKLVFTTCLALLIATIGMAEFTEYDNLKAVFGDIIGSQIEGRVEEVEPDIENVSQEELEDVYQALLEMCEGQNSIDISIPESDESVTVDCNELREAGSLEGANLTTVAKNAIVDPIFDGIYYKEYDCGFLECMQTGQFLVMFSEQGHEFFSEIQIYLSVGVAVGAVIILVLSKTWPDRLKGLGWPLVFTGVSYVIFELGKMFISEILPGEEEVGINILSITKTMLDPMINAFLVVLVAGIAMVATGYALAYKEKKKKNKK